MTLPLTDVPAVESTGSVNYASGLDGGEKDRNTPSVLLDINKKPLPKMGGNGTSISPSLVQENTKRKRGRPRDDDPNKPARIAKWIPKNWTPVYEEIVSLDCMGMAQKEIAEKFSMTAVMVSKICCTPQAKIFRRKVLEVLAERNKTFQKDRFERVQVRAMERISTVLEDDNLFEADPFAVVDRAFKLLEKTKVLGGGEGKGDINIAGNVNMLSQTAILEIKDGLAKAREAKELHKDLEAIDVTSPVVERGRRR
ncbi:hypothetical protein LCGC14_3084450 [marine sediment metagenome]|uniref:Uncharacterized protein n=1 Tax=marine sediment metagenome TaxID=412755 RepID=A0A0F8WCC5_9ZZZZ